MPAAHPTILATSGGFIRGKRGALEFGPLLHYGIELASAHGRTARLCHLGTANGDRRSWNAEMDEAAMRAGVELTHLNLFPMPTFSNLEEHLMSQDMVWVGGGSVANLLALWRLHGLDTIFPKVWEAGIVLAGVSAGSLCWHIGGTTDSFGPDLQPVTNGLALLPFANGVHYDSELQRRPLLQSLVANGTLPTAYATDDGVGLHYQGTTLVEAVTEVPGKSAYLVRSVNGTAEEERLPTRLLTS